MSDSDTEQWYIEATVVREREADWLDRRVTRVGRYDVATLGEAKRQFYLDHKDETGFVKVDFNGARIRPIGGESA